ncbi:alternative oxidase [Hamiltosporidium magnivora]|uniref:Alternative oxidase n=1 Tax=Hamiltosporidium magnivora TaxID=148818 RepID=A0A4Q9LKM0_9MICR|nr:alternative oxidase [Hamiltosporidium magnivora]
MLLKNLLTTKNPFINKESLKDITKGVIHSNNDNSILKGYIAPRRYLEITPINNREYLHKQHPFNNEDITSYKQHPFNKQDITSYKQHPFNDLYNSSNNQHPFTDLYNSSNNQHPFNNIYNSSNNQHPFISQRRFYYPQPVREEFKKKITLTQLKEINYKKDFHFKPQRYSDYISYSLVKGFRFLADLYFRKRYVHRAIVLETVASIPGMVGGLFRHLYSLRRTVDNGTSIQKLLLEAENERQHLLTFLEISKPSFLDTLVIYTGQIFFFSFYFIFYFLFPKSAHRFVGYLEEEAIRSYDMFEEEIKNKNIENVFAPKRAILYWNLPHKARLIDVVRAVRADEAAHRDTNHAFANELECVNDKRCNYKGVNNSKYN